MEIFASLLIESLAEAGVPPHRLAREHALAMQCLALGGGAASASAAPAPA